jgi:hypothetical protein
MRKHRPRLIVAFLLTAALFIYLIVPKPQALPSPSAILASPTSTVPLTPTPNLALERFSRAVHVVGDHLVTTTGETIALRGVNRDGSDYLCAEGAGIIEGPTGPKSIAALKSWRINAVRIPLNEGCWLQVGDLKPEYSGSNYQQAIKQYVDDLTAQGIYVILDLHKIVTGQEVNTHGLHPMPDAEHTPVFWTQVANAYKDDGMVLFDVYNEPHDVGWPCLRDGNCPTVSYPTVGMQTLTNTIRQTGATNVLLVSGVGWSDDLTHWLDFTPRDPLSNIGASWHVYPHDSWCGNVTCYERVIAPIAAKYPLVVTEFNAGLYGTYCGTDGLATLLTWLDSHGAGYTAFTWNVGDQSCGSLSLISNYDGTPHPPNGAFYRDYLAKVVPVDTIDDGSAG